MRTRIAQVAERRARNPEVRGSNPGSNLAQVFLSRSYNIKCMKMSLNSSGELETNLTTMNEIT